MSATIDAAWITGIIETFMQGPDNDLRMPDGPEPAFKAPLVAFASGADSIWVSYKEHIGEDHWTPLEAFALAFPGERPAPEDLTVISWILPQTKATCADNRKQDKYPAERWARARIMGENLVNVKLREHVVSRLSEAGLQALAPMLIPEWSRRDSEKFTFSSTWSERHAAHAAGLGTFGLCDALITPAGKAMRTGSVIARLRIPATKRPYTHHREYCLFFSHGICGKCIKKCPVNALSEKGHDKILCRDHLRPGTSDYVKEHYGFEGYGCGLCQVGVPCEDRIPPKPARK